MTKEEILKLHIADLNNLVADSDAKRSRIIDLEDELESLIPSVINWVACKDALPKHETDVICYCLDFEVRVGRKTGDFWFIDGYSLPQDITHWQELPDPPCL